MRAQVVLQGKGSATVAVDYEPQACALRSDATEAAVGGKDGQIRIYAVSADGLTEKQVCVQ